VWDVKPTKEAWAKLTLKKNNPRKIEKKTENKKKSKAWVQSMHNPCTKKYLELNNCRQRWPNPRKTGKKIKK